MFVWNRSACKKACSQCFRVQSVQILQNIWRLYDLYIHIMLHIQRNHSSLWMFVCSFVWFRSHVCVCCAVQCILMYLCTHVCNAYLLKVLMLFLANMSVVHATDIPNAQQPEYEERFFHVCIIISATVAVVVAISIEYAVWIYVKLVFRFNLIQS